MLTCCPACRTCFRITEAQLAMAQGKVRCGKCKTVFNARQHLKPLPGQQPPEPPPPTPPAAPEIPEPPPSVPTTSETDHIDLFLEREPEPETPAPEPETVASAPPEEPEADASGESRYKYNDFDDEIVSEQELDDILAEMNQQLSLGVDQPGPDLSGRLDIPDEPEQSAGSQNKPRDELGEAIDSLFADLQAEEEPDTISTQELEAFTETDEPEVQEPDDFAAEFDDSAPDVEAEGEPFGDEPDFVDEKIEDDVDDREAVPLRLRDSLAIQPPPPRSWLKVLGGSLMILLLVILLAGQLLLFRPLDVTRWIPQTRPYLEQLCQFAPCHFDADREPEQIRLLNRDVRAHPDKKKALLITATLINEAETAQTYPELQVTLFDLSGNRVAQRQFTPADYLGEAYSPFMQMQPQTPLQIKLEVVDPGNNAVNFEFSFR